MSIQRVNIVIGYEKSGAFRQIHRIRDKVRRWLISVLAAGDSIMMNVDVSARKSDEGCLNAIGHSLIGANCSFDGGVKIVTNGGTPADFSTADNPH